MQEQRFNLKIINSAYTQAEWATLNPILFKYEIGIESDTGFFKFGNGISSWNELPYSRSALNELKEGNGISIENNVISVNLRYNIIEEHPDE